MNGQKGGAGGPRNVEKRRNPYERFVRWLSYRKLAAAAGVLFALSLLPILLLSFFDYATGDDLGYGAALHQVLASGGSLGDALSAIASQVHSSYLGWQGTWSSIVLFCLSPNVWGERFYMMVPWLALVFLLGGTWYLLREVLRRRMGLPWEAFWLIFFVLSFLTVQYMPYMRGGIFWYTSVAHYVLPYGAALCAVTWAMRYLETGKRRFFAGLTVVMAYLGGAGYPPLLLAGTAVFLLMAGALARRWKKTALSGPAQAARETMQADGRRRGAAVSSRTPAFRRALWLLLPLALLAAGFIVSAKAPGNAVRGGEAFGFSLPLAASTVAGGMVQALTGLFGYFRTVRPLFLLPLLVIVTVWETTERERAQCFFRHPVAAVLVCWLLTGVVIMPGLYAGVEVSGGVPDTIYFTTLLMTTAATAYLTGFCKGKWLERRERSVCQNVKSAGGADVRAVTSKTSARLEKKSAGGADVSAAVSETSAMSEKNAAACSGCAASLFARRVRVPFLLAALCFCLLFGRHLVGGTVDYVCIDFVRSGQLADFQAQMQERLALLNDSDAEDVVVPEMNSEQGPFMHMALMRDKDSFTNRATARFYGKRSVVAVPREEFEAMQKEAAQ